LKSGDTENPNSLLKFWVWESGRKIDPATGVTPVAGSIFGTLSQTYISKRVFMNEISSSSLRDIQLTLFCVCGVNSFLPELEHL